MTFEEWYAGDAWISEVVIHGKEFTVWEVAKHAWQARDLLASSPSQPDGWKLVPAEPTMLMYDAWVDAKKNGHDDGVFGTWIAAYKAICAAAPALGEGER